jgi:hypothetical protein
VATAGAAIALDDAQKAAMPAACSGRIADDYKIQPDAVQLGPLIEKADKTFSIEATIKVDPNATKTVRCDFGKRGRLKTISDATT